MDALDGRFRSGKLVLQVAFPSHLDQARPRRGSVAFEGIKAGGSGRRGPRSARPRRTGLLLHDFAERNQAVPRQPGRPDLPAAGRGLTARAAGADQAMRSPARCQASCRSNHVSARRKSMAGLPCDLRCSSSSIARSPTSTDVRGIEQVACFVEIERPEMDVCKACRRQADRAAPARPANGRGRYHPPGEVPRTRAPFRVDSRSPAPRPRLPSGRDAPRRQPEASAGRRRLRRQGRRLRRSRAFPSRFVAETPRECPTRRRNSRAFISAARSTRRRRATTRAASATKRRNRAVLPAPGSPVIKIGPRRRRRTPPIAGLREPGGDCQPAGS